SFVGTLSILRGQVTDPGRGTIVVDGQEIVAARGLEEAHAGEARSGALRPEIVSLDETDGHGNRRRGTVGDGAVPGSIVRSGVRFGENKVSLDPFNKPASVPPQPGQVVTVTFPRDAVLVLEGSPTA